jgi:hypothetical protein
VAEVHVLIDASAEVRLAGAADFLRRRAAEASPVIVVGASRGAADELVVRVALERGGMVGISRAGIGELATRLALHALARQGLLPTPALGAEAVAARATFEALAAGALEYFAPVAAMPGFPRALGRTLAEVRMAGIGPEALGGDAAIADLSELLARANSERRKAGAVDYATLLATATEAAAMAESIRHAHLLLLDVPAATTTEAPARRASPFPPAMPGRSTRCRSRPTAPTTARRPLRLQHRYGRSSVCSGSCSRPRRRHQLRPTTRWFSSRRRVKAAKRSRSRGVCSPRPRAACLSTRWRCSCARRRPI